MLDDRIHIGDVFRIGGALLEVTKPRLPCFKLEMKMDLPKIKGSFRTLAAAPASVTLANTSL
jgi:MOSC domain-containing protein YiiM